MIALLLSLFLINEALSFSCKDQNNKDVDWFAVYKMPMEEDGSIPGIGQGVGWYYVDSNIKGNLNASTKTLNDNDQAVAYTLSQLYDNKADSTNFYVMYNDEPFVDDASSVLMKLRANRIKPEFFEYGHTKGTTFFDSKSGVWLIHSVPKFPPPDNYEYPRNGHHYGQTMLCLSLPYSELGKIATQLYYNKPDIYSSNLPTTMASDYPVLAQVIAGQYKQGQPFYSIVELTTVGGATFKSFAKTDQFNNDLYDGLVAPALQTDLVAETWRRGSEVPLDCSVSYHTNDALAIQVGSTISFKYTKDHSKIARSTDPRKPWLCIGDINRMTSQYIRGGGTTCISSTFLWRAFNVIKDENQC